MLKNWKSLALALAGSVGLSVVLTACGGGGDGSSSGGTSIPTSGRYVSTQFTGAEITTHSGLVYSERAKSLGVQYTSSDTQLEDIASSTLSLKLDVLMPPDATSSARKPLVVWIHGGGFYEGSKSDTYDEALTYARAGYVAATVNYRLTAEAQTNASIRLASIQEAEEDVMNAIRYLKQNAATYGIDTTRIVTFGASAGGALAQFNAIDADTLWGLQSDYPGVSSKVAAAVTTGAVLGNPADAATVFSFSSSDSPLLLFHAKETDSETSFTWTDYVLPNQKLINDSGNSCVVVAQPNLTHTVDLSLGGAYWSANILPFLWAKLSLSAL